MTVVGQARRASNKVSVVGQARQASNKISITVILQYVQLQNNVVQSCVQLYIYAVYRRLCQSRFRRADYVSSKFMLGPCRSSGG
jgi:arginyl-tRNA--protein-N-Asp/Glu arginylyltransferase